MPIFFLAAHGQRSSHTRRKIAMCVRIVLTDVHTIHTSEMVERLRLFGQARLDDSNEPLYALADTVAVHHRDKTRGEGKSARLHRT